MPDSQIDLTGLPAGAEPFLAAVLETTEQPIWIVDDSDVVRFANPAALTALGYDSTEELIGRPASLHRRRHEATYQLVRRDGSAFPVSCASVPIDLKDGHGAVELFTDLEGRLAAVLAGQQASLRRVATLVAAGAPAADVFAAIAREVAEVIDLPLVAVWRFEADGTATVVGEWSETPHPFEAGTNWPLDGPTICSRIRATGRPARIDDFSTIPGTVGDAARDSGIRSAAGAPIIVDGALWGAMSTDSTDAAPLPDDLEERLVAFTELVAATFTTMARQDELALLADEQAALRRVATLVAQAVPSAELFRSVTEEVGRLVAADAAATIRYEPGDVVTAVGNWTAEGVDADTEVGRPFPLAGESLAPRILATGQSARIDDWGDVPGPIAEYVRTRLRISSSVGSPILVEGRVWGNLAVHSASGPLPADTEERMTRFTQLVATAIVNAQARADVRRLADEQAALRRVATLVARQRQPAEVLAAVAEEVGRLLPVEDTSMLRYEADGSATVVASWSVSGDALRVGAHLPVEGANVTARVHATGRPARLDDYETASGPLGDRMRELGVSAAVGCPITVDGRLWGVMVAAQRQAQPLPADTESRVSQFTELTATAISNVQARAELAASRARIAVASDDERRRVVRDLHDGAQQRLVHTVITLQMANDAVENAPENVPTLLSDALEQCRQAVAELRELAHGIMPSILTHGGLSAGVQALAMRSSVPVGVDVAVERLPPPVEATAYFVVSEALTNVAKHARANRADVSARVSDGTLEVRVHDDGIGGARTDGTGLRGLGDRLAVLDGQLRIESPLGGGTMVAAAIPLSAPVDGT